MSGLFEQKIREALSDTGRELWWQDLFKVVAEAKKDLLKNPKTSEEVCTWWSHGDKEQWIKVKDVLRWFGE